MFLRIVFYLAEDDCAGPIRVVSQTVDGNDPPLVPGGTNQLFKSLLGTLEAEVFIVFGFEDETLEAAVAVVANGFDLPAVAVA